MAEYQQFDRALARAHPAPRVRHAARRCPAEFRALFEGVALARRLREVRAQVGFTRIQPPGGMFRADNAQLGQPLAANRLPWLPAIELRGEGIFLAFRQETANRRVGGSSPPTPR